MGLFDLFKRRESADDAMLAVAAACGWTPVPAPNARAMLPPTHDTFDVVGLDGRSPPHCAGRAFDTTLPAGACPAVVSHLEVAISDTEDSVYDVVAWRPALIDVPRFELAVDASAWSDHRLGDRFAPHGARRIRSPSGPSLNVSRAVVASVAQALASHPGMTALQTCAARIGSGFCAEVIDGRAAVFTYSAAPRRGRERWRALVEAADALNGVIVEVAGPR